MTMPFDLSAYAGYAAHLFEVMRRQRANHLLPDRGSTTSTTSTIHDRRRCSDEADDGLIARLLAGELVMRFLEGDAILTRCVDQGMQVHITTDQDSVIACVQEFVTSITTFGHISIPIDIYEHRPERPGPALLCKRMRILLTRTHENTWLVCNERPLSKCIIRRSSKSRSDSPVTSRSQSQSAWSWLADPEWIERLRRCSILEISHDDVCAWMRGHANFPG
jgi:hypothetical protein